MLGPAAVEAEEWEEPLLPLVMRAERRGLLFNARSMVCSTARIKSGRGGGMCLSSAAVAASHCADEAARAALAAKLPPSAAAPGGGAAALPLLLLLLLLLLLALLRPAPPLSAVSQHLCHHLSARRPRASQNCRKDRRTRWECGPARASTDAFPPSSPRGSPPLLAEARNTSVISRALREESVGKACAPPLLLLLLLPPSAPLAAPLPPPPLLQLPLLPFPLPPLLLLPSASSKSARRVKKRGRERAAGGRGRWEWGCRGCCCAGRGCC